MSADALDAETLDLLRGLEADDPGFLPGLFADYLRRGAALVSAMDEAIVRRDPSALKTAAHELKGASATIGALAVRDLSLSLEQAALAGDWAAATASRARCAGEISRVQSAVETLGLAR